MASAVSPSKDWGVSSAAALVLSATLGVAAIEKGRALGVFRQQIADYRLMPYALTRIVAPTVILWEAASAVLLISPATRQVGALLAVPLLVLFAVILAAVWRLGREVSCGCFGGSGELDTVGIHGIVRALLLLVVAGIAAYPTTAGLSWRDVVSAFLLGGLVFLGGEVARLLGDLRRPSIELARALKTDAQSAERE